MHQEKVSGMSQKKKKKILETKKEYIFREVFWDVKFF